MLIYSFKLYIMTTSEQLKNGTVTLTNGLAQTWTPETFMILGYADNLSNSKLKLRLVCSNQVLWALEINTDNNSWIWNKINELGFVNLSLSIINHEPYRIVFINGKNNIPMFRCVYSLNQNVTTGLPCEGSLEQRCLRVLLFDLFCNTMAFKEIAIAVSRFDCGFLVTNKFIVQ